jgi:hypothetical protein
MRLFRSIFIIAFVALAHPVRGESVVPVYVTMSGDDSVGNRLAYAVREGVRKSSSMTLVDSYKDSRFVLSLVTLDPSREKDGYSTVYSAVYTFRTFHDKPVRMYLNTIVGTCGSSKIDSCANGLIADLDRELSEYRAATKK